MSRASYILHWRRNDGRKVNFGTLFPNGDLNTNYIVDNAKEIGDPQIGVDYLEAVARLVPGATIKKDGKYWTWRVVVGGRKPKMADALERSDEWLTAIGRAIVAFNRLEEGGLDSTGVVLLRFPACSRSGIGEAVADLVNRRGEDLTGRFVVLQPGRARIGPLHELDVWRRGNTNRLIGDQGHLHPGPFGRPEQDLPDRRRARIGVHPRSSCCGTFLRDQWSHSIR